jgi:hypothetical protein
LQQFEGVIQEPRFTNREFCSPEVLVEDLPTGISEVIVVGYFVAVIDAQEHAFYWGVE